MGLPSRPVVLVTDGDQRATLAVVRSLGAASFTVLVTSPRAGALAGASRYAQREIVVPSPLDDPHRYLDALEQTARSESVELLLPITDASLLAVLGARERFPLARIPFVALDQFQRISDKATVLETAKRLGIATPSQRVLNSAGALASIHPETIPYPVVLKPTRSVVERGPKRFKMGVSYAAGPAELSRRVEAYPPEAFPLLLQQRIVGPGIGVFLLIWDGEPIAMFGHRRIRETPPSGGVSAYRESFMPSEALVDHARRLLNEFRWQGVAMVEFKVDEVTGTPYLMEVNGRFWGSLQLAIDAGVDFPTLLARAALDGGAAPVVRGRLGVQSRWEWGDASYLLARLRHGSRELGLPPGGPGKLRAIVDVLRWRRGDRLEVLRISDPLPFLRESIDWLRRR